MSSLHLSTDRRKSSVIYYSPRSATWLSSFKEWRKMLRQQHQAHHSSQIIIGQKKGHEILHHDTWSFEQEMTERGEKLQRKKTNNMLLLRQQSDQARDNNSSFIPNQTNQHPKAIG